MSQAVLEGRPFRVDPTSVSWNYQVNTSEQQTLGGKVVQIFGTTISDLTVEGAFGIGGWQEQRDYLAFIKDLGSQQLDRWPQPNREPFRFTWPQQGWDFKVWLLDFTEPGSSGAVNLNAGNSNPKWSLSFFVVDDDGKLKTVSEDAYIARLSAGIGWKQTKFNGRMSSDEVQAALTTVGAKNFTEYLSIGYGLTNPTSTGNAGQTTGGASTPGTVPADTDVKKYTQDLANTNFGWSGAQWDALATVVNMESSWNVNAQNPTSTAYGLFQFLNDTWAAVGVCTKDEARADWHKMVLAGLTYVKQRYGNPVSALAHENQYHWY